MNTDQKYILDTNVFREAHKRYYAFDICPDFWTFLIEAHEKGILYSIDKVRKELLALSDENEDGQKRREELGGRTSAEIRWSPKLALNSFSSQIIFTRM